MSASPTLLVLAAGMSSRYGGTSKQTDGMGPNGETLLDYSVFDALRAGFGKVVFIIRKEAEAAFREKVVARLEKAVPIELAYQDMHDLPAGFTTPAERKKPWGTGHAVLAARNQLHEPFCVINADDFYGRDSFASMAAFLTQPNLNAAETRCSSVGFVLKNTLSEHGKVARGICQVGSDGLLGNVVEMTDIFKTPTGAENRQPDTAPVSLTGEEIVSMNMWGFVPGVLPGFWREFGAFLAEKGQNPTAEYYIPLGVDRLIKAGEEQVRVLPTTSKWFGVTYQEDKPLVQAALLELLATGEYPEQLWT
jgi:UTP-glucose-1-phosphate uridylyltransferase